MRAIVIRTQTCFCLIQKSHTNKSVFKNLYLRLLLPSTLRLPPSHIKLRLMYGGRLTECQFLDKTSYYYDVPAKTWYVKMRLQKARPLGELRRKAVRGHNVRSKTLSVTQACHLSQSERLFEISIFRWDNVLQTNFGRDIVFSAELCYNGTNRKPPSEREP